MVVGILGMGSDDTGYRQPYEIRRGTAMSRERPVVAEALLDFNNCCMYVDGRNTEYVPIANECGLVAGVRYTFHLNRENDKAYAIGPDPADKQSRMLWDFHVAPKR